MATELRGLSCRTGPQEVGLAILRAAGVAFWHGYDGSLITGPESWLGYLDPDEFNINRRLFLIIINYLLMSNIPTEQNIVHMFYSLVQFIRRPWEFASYVLLWLGGWYSDLEQDVLGRQTPRRDAPHGEILMLYNSHNPWSLVTMSKVADMRTVFIPVFSSP